MSIQDEQRLQQCLRRALKAADEISWNSSDSTDLRCLTLKTINSLLQLPVERDQRCRIILGK